MNQKKKNISATTPKSFNGEPGRGGEGDERFIKPAK